MSNPNKTGVGTAILAAALFGASTPFSKLLLGDVSPILLAGLLYLGSGVGMSLLWAARRLRQAGSTETPLVRKDWPWLAGAIGSGTIAGALLLMFGLQLTPASTSSLLLNMEGVFTASLAWLVFRESADRRVVLGMVFILLGGMALSWQGSAGSAPLLGVVLVIAACLAWGTDNNLTQKISASDPFQVAAIKGLVAGVFNTALAFGLGAPFPPLGVLVAGLLMGVGVWLHLTERHSHMHQHTQLEHAHLHTHDEHHQHGQGYEVVDLKQPHEHLHIHAAQTHTHRHYPDIHHRHVHAPD